MAAVSSFINLTSSLPWRPAVRCIAFHEKAVKVDVRFGIGLPCGLWWWSMFRSNLPQKGGTLPSGYRSYLLFQAMHRNRSGLVLSPQGCAGVSLIGRLVFPQA